MDFRAMSNSMITRLLAFAALYISFGVVTFHWLEKFGWVDSLYFVVVTLGTVGYGDFAPQTQAGRLFAVAFIIFGIVIFVGFAKIMLIQVGRKIVKARSKKKKLR